VKVPLVRTESTVFGSISTPRVSFKVS